MGIHSDSLYVVIVVVGACLLLGVLFSALGGEGAKKAREIAQRGIQKQGKCSACSGQLVIGKEYLFTSIWRRGKLIGTARCENCGRLEFFA